MHPEYLILLSGSQDYRFIISDLSHRSLDELDELDISLGSRLHKKLNKYTYKYLSVLQKREPLDDNNSIDRNNLLYMYAYLRYIPYDQCLDYYRRHDLMDVNLLPFMPTAVMTLRLPITFLKYHVGITDVDECIVHWLTGMLSVRWEPEILYVFIYANHSYDPVASEIWEHLIKHDAICSHMKLITPKRVKYSKVNNP